ncbi:MAG: hypothetical protein EPO28_08900 [Saprospiraceae bacterium]|nr:MAG: hypothetical protein EPO28_08900 [Saprospiraceae bacterium]
MISESTIESVIAQFERGETDYDNAACEFASRQPSLLSFLISEQEGALSEEEREFLFYLATVIWKSVELENPGLPAADSERISDAEEANWAILDASQKRSFREQLDLFFENYPEEDLLAFVEDALTIDEEDLEDETFHLTSEGVEPMFISLKTMIDVLTEN